MKLLIYIISISLQMAGTLLLMCFSISTNRKTVIIKFKDKNIIYRNGNTKEIEYDNNEFKNTFKQAYLTRFSFLYIALGYITGIFGEVENSSKFIIVLSTIIFTFFFMVIAYFIVKLIIKYSKKVNLNITNDELEQLQINPTIQSISNDEIDEIFKDI